MKVFTCTDFDGHWPVGVAAVVVAESENEARDMLGAELLRAGLPQIRGFTLVEVDLSSKSCNILRDGDY